MPECLLVDNGSIRPASTLSLRRIAAALEARIGERVAPVSLQHSNRVDAAELGGVPAEILVPAMETRLNEGITDFVILPLFFGPSLAVTGHLPGRVRALREEHPELQARVGPPLFDLSAPEDDRLARILAERIDEVWPVGERPAVAVVDHGSPTPEVAEVRDRVATGVASLLGDRVARVAAASMERREGDQYDFNEPLLEKLLRTEGFDRGTVVIAMLFLSPGRHAGPAGDIETICRDAEKRQPGLRIVRTGLVGDHPDLIPILADRYRQSLDTEPG